MTIPAEVAAVLAEMHAHPEPAGHRALQTWADRIESALTKAEAVAPLLDDTVRKATEHMLRGGAIKIEYVAQDEMRVPVESPQHCPVCKFTMSGVGRCVNCVPTESLGRDADTQMEGWHAAIDAAAELVGNAPDDRFRRRAEQVERWIENNRPVPPALPVASVPDGWRCFHCCEEFTDRESAALHFGTHEHQEPACLINIAKFREMEALQLRYVDEDADVHRAMRRMESGHQQALRRAEEDGYAKGLVDAVKYPQDATPPTNQEGGAP